MGCPLSTAVNDAVVPWADPSDGSTATPAPASPTHANSTSLRTTLLSLGSRDKHARPGGPTRRVGGSGSGQVRVRVRAGPGPVRALLRRLAPDLDRDLLDRERDR